MYELIVAIFIELSVLLGIAFIGLVLRAVVPDKFLVVILSVLLIFILTFSFNFLKDDFGDAFPFLLTTCGILGSFLPDIFHSKPEKI